MFRAPLQRDRLAVSGQGRGTANHRAKQPAPALESEEANMNSHSEIEEPRTAAEIIARYRDVRHRLYSPASPPKLASNETRTNHAACKAITTIPAPSRQPEQGPSETPLQYQTPAREALRAVSTSNRRAPRRHPRTRSAVADRRRSSRGYLARRAGDRLVIAALGKVLQTRSHDRAPLDPRDEEALGP